MRFILMGVLGALACFGQVADEGQWLYTPDQEVTISGEVSAVKNVTIGNQHSRIFKVKVADEQQLQLYLGPDWYLEQNGIDVKVGTGVRVTGARVHDKSLGELLLGREIEVGLNIFILRDYKGRTIWSLTMSTQT